MRYRWLTWATGHVEVDVPRDCDGSFEPVIVDKPAATAERGRQGRRDRRVQVVAGCPWVDDRWISATFASIGSLGLGLRSLANDWSLLGQAEVVMA